MAAWRDSSEYIGAVHPSISNIYRTLAEANNEYCNLAIKMCKYEHQAILTEDSALLEEAKESFGEKVKKVIEKIWRSIVDAFAKFKNWLRQIIVKIGSKNASRAISDNLISHLKNVGAVTISGVNKETLDALKKSKAGVIGTVMKEILAGNDPDDDDGGFYKDYLPLISVEAGGEGSTVVITSKDLEALKESLKNLPSEFNDTVKAENDARSKYRESLKKEDKKPIETAAKASATAFKAARNKIKFITKIITAVRKHLKAQTGLNKAGNKFSKAQEDLD